MNKTETQEILRRVAVVDNRKVGPETLDAWHDIIGAIPFDIAKEALLLAQKDATIKYLEPRHVYGWAKEAAFRLDRKIRPVQEQVISSPAPKCKHEKSLPMCAPCCKELAA